ncbi:class A/C sortase, partial [Enterococcus hulanensis]|nr:class A/C sortase [Enterococcus hulanensis]MDT2611914.1 class A/C sortase [Enterococcus hulanensis]MDT2619012.1 class A/C sortase [Enterococcus hulanensis]MDT2630591.1 class A/C sortase [Enterococcus hulanensis]MDT2658001.1 class A/C sortase [Enterococcus hulanensis]
NLKSVHSLHDAEDDLFKQMKLKRDEGKIDGTLLKEDPVSEPERVSMTLAAKIISDPMQTVVPLFLLFLLPILFFSLI